MILNETKKLLEDKFSKGEVEIVKITGDEIRYKLPYSFTEFEMMITTDTLNGQIEEFVEQINWDLEQMANHCEDCKISLQEVLQ